MRVIREGSTLPITCLGSYCGQHGNRRKTWRRTNKQETRAAHKHGQLQRAVGELLPAVAQQQTRNAGSYCGELPRATEGKRGAEPRTRNALTNTPRRLQGHSSFPPKPRSCSVTSVTKTSTSQLEKTRKARNVCRGQKERLTFTKHTHASVARSVKRGGAMSRVRYILECYP